MDGEERDKEYQTDYENQELFQYEPPEENRKKRSKLFIKLAAILTLAVFLFYYIPDFSFYLSDKFNFIRENGSLIEDEIVKKCRPAVVYVEAVDAEGGVKQGTGFNVSPEGVIITNKHVVKDAQVVTITLSDNRKFYSKNFTLDNENDIAMVKLNGSNLPVLVVNNTNEPKKGETVTVIGNPLGYWRISQRGSIEDANFYIGESSSVLKINVKVNPGSSGSPVINSSAEVVGIVFASMENKALAVSSRNIEAKGIEDNQR